MGGYVVTLSRDFQWPFTPQLGGTQEPINAAEPVSLAWVEYIVLNLQLKTNPDKAFGATSRGHTRHKVSRPEVPRPEGPQEYNDQLMLLAS